jgi:hypothetical protein
VSKGKHTKVESPSTEVSPPPAVRSRALTAEELLGRPVEPPPPPPGQVGGTNMPGGKPAQRFCGNCNKPSPLAEAVCGHCMPNYRAPVAVEMRRDPVPTHAVFDMQNPCGR